MAITDNLISFWKFDESSGNASDSIGSNTLTNNNSIAYSSGKVNNGADLEASSNNYFSRLDSSSLSLTGDFTFSLWVKLESAPSSTIYMLVLKYLTGGDNRSYSIGYEDSSGTKRFETRISSDGTSGNTTIRTLNYTLNTGTWYHVVFLYTASTGTIEVYVNNSSVGSMTTHKTSIYDGTADFRIGTNDDADRFFDGMIDAMGVWSRVLSSGEISTLYNSGNGIQYPPDSAIKTINGLAKASTKTINGLAIASVKTWNGLT